MAEPGSMFVQEIVRSISTPKPVDIVEFCESDQYCNRPLYPAQRVLLKLWFLKEMEGWEEDILNRWIRGEDEVVISPGIRQRVEYLRNAGFPHFREIVTVIGRRGSKGYCTGAAVAKKIYDTAQHPDPGAHWGIDPEKQIVFAAIAPKFSQARDNQFEDISAWVRNCKPLVRPGGPIRKFLEESFTVHTEADDALTQRLRANGIEVSADWSKLICQPMPGNASTVRGQACMVIVYDEMAHMIGVEGRASAEEVYAAATPSLRQFGYDSMMFCCSTPWNQTGQFYKEWEKAMLMDGSEPAYPTMMTIHAPAWSLFKNWDRDPKKRFDRVGALQVSPDATDSELIPEEVGKKLIAVEEERGDPEKYKVETRAQWQMVTEAYLRPETVDRMFVPIYRPQGGSDFSKVIGANYNGDYHYQFKMHGDPSSTTAGFGFACGHLENMPDPFEPAQIVPHVVMDFVHRWNPATFPGHTIKWETVIDDIVGWARAFHPFEITFDQFDSTAPIQTLTKLMRQHRVSASVHEVTASPSKNYKRYEVFKTVANLGLVHVPVNCVQTIPGGDPLDHSERAKLELKFLHVHNGKIDRQRSGPIQTKDIADCIMEVTAALLGDFVQQRAEMLGGGVLMSGQGGYSGVHNPAMREKGLGGVSSFDELRLARKGTAQTGPMPQRGVFSSRERRRRSY